MHAYLNTCEHAHKHTNIHTNMHTYIHTCIHTYTRICIHTYKHTCIHTYRHSCLHTNMHSYIHTNMHSFIHTYIYTCIQLKPHIIMPSDCYVFFYPNKNSCSYRSMKKLFFFSIVHVFLFLSSFLPILKHVCSHGWTEYVCCHIKHVASHIDSQHHILELENPDNTHFREVIVCPIHTMKMRRIFF